MSYGLNVEMHKQTEICKRLDAIIRQVLPFLSAEHQQQVALAVDRAKQITITELNAVMQVNTTHLPFFNQYCDLTGKSNFYYLTILLVKILYEIKTNIAI